ncbi:CotS family spore coat protein [Clostridium sporogenes]|uniref:CotS family spore coat protein n=1 Tax=Clostridium botulinum TaxID=1491 RepID=A0A6M0SYR0_CLOBO|nr:CotS family spore coat protein [Clostridium sporogenes]NFA60639.1 CotS family spore coat protein [Clostridium botulinum]NFI74191.1 CotS family spore coat protein [Clostridium sporogenes]NFL72265.1 CotS family spore coat protein [Clostridium sporogenes]NFM25521.1 CotS family spore coat protein [Clostridium sporogenes]NFP62065.1 CotS family spore coat protein [Clostridium sporogenes]
MDKLNKNYLKKYNLSLDLFDQYDIRVKDVYPIRNVYIIDTDKGKKILKKVNYTIEELKFIQEIIDYIKVKFERIMKFEKNLQGDIYTIYKGEMYCLMELIDGRECQFSNPLDLKISSIGLAEMHKASKGFTINFNKKVLNGKSIEKFKIQKEEMNFFKKIANIHKNKNEFDNLFLSQIDYYIDDISKSINILENSCYYDICKEDDKIAICHHDLAYHNILIKENKAYFIDFDYAILDLKVNDLCNFITKVIKNFAFDINKVNIILNNYSNIYNVTHKELEVLYGLLSFPYDFYDISKNYYTKRKDWNEEVFLNRLIKKCSYKEDREEFLKKFKNSIL